MGHTSSCCGDEKECLESDGGIPDSDDDFVIVPDNLLEVTIVDIAREDLLMAGKASVALLSTPLMNNTQENKYSINRLLLLDCVFY